MLGPAAFQAALVQQPDPARISLSSDIKLVTRQSGNGGSAQPPPPGMVLVTGGDTTVGTDPEQVESLGQRDPIQMTDILAETPRHIVPVDPFYIDRTEVTNLQWRVFLEATQRKPSATLVEFGWPNGEIPKGQEHFPIANVNVPEIRDYLVWSGRRLPTEEEWVRAARGETQNVYPWGDRWEPARCRSGEDAKYAPVAVGSFPKGATESGVMDLAGNVFEWVDSPFIAFERFQPLQYGRGRQKNLLTPEFDSTRKVIKGGGFSAVRQFVRIDTRLGQNPTDSDAALGFRTARSHDDGLEIIRHAWRRLLPPRLTSVENLDLRDVFGQETTSYTISEGDRLVITGVRHLAFAHRAAERGAPLSKLRRTARDEPETLGILATSEPISMTDMDAWAATRSEEGAAPRRHVLPAGEYLLVFKAEGESKAHKDKRRLESKLDKERGRGGDEDEPPATEGAAGDPGLRGAAVPWPGVSSIHDIQEDIEFDQDVDAILFCNANGVVVGWCKPTAIEEHEVAPVTGTAVDGGKQWNISFSLDQVTGRRGPRFSMQVQFDGAGLPPAGH